MEQNLSKTPIKWRASAIVLAICLVLMVVTSVIGHNIQTSGGTVRTEDLTFTTDVGATSHAKLYIPETATAETPAPAILLCHGYTASLDAMESNAIELSRRGYVVMALDMYGHGESTLPSDGYKQAEMGNVENYAPDLGSYSALQQFKILGIRAAKPPVLVHHISDAGLCLFHAVPVQVPDRKLELLLVVVSWAALVPVQQEFIVFREFPDHRRYAFIGILLDGGIAAGLALFEQKPVALDLGRADHHSVGASLSHPLHVEVASVGKIISGWDSADQLKHLPHRPPCQ